jgi:hypothetical protein
VIWVSASTAFPFSMKGRYFHCLTASICLHLHRGQHPRKILTVFFAKLADSLSCDRGKMLLKMARCLTKAHLDQRLTRGLRRMFLGRWGFCCQPRRNQKRENRGNQNKRAHGRFLRIDRSELNRIVSCGVVTSGRRPQGGDSGDLGRTCPSALHNADYSWLILAKNSLLVLALAKRSMRSSMASTGDSGFRTLRRTQMRWRSSFGISNSSFRVPER